MSIDSSVEVVVLSVSLSEVVSVVAEMWLVVLQLPVSGISMSEVVMVFSMEGSCVVWVFVMGELMWSQIVMWNVPS